MHGARRVARFVVHMALVLSSSACFTLARTEQGSAPSAAGVAEIRRGARLEYVIERLGAPVQTVEQREGLLLVYRAREFVWRRIGIQPGLLFQFVDPVGGVGAALSNLSFVYQWGDVSERRLVVLFDEEQRVETVAFRDQGGG